MEILKCHVLALIIGFVLDIVVGDPHLLPHPIRLIGRFISFIEKKTYKDKKSRGLLLIVVVVTAVFSVTFVLIYFSYHVSYVVGIIAESILTFYCLATKSLAVESKAVITALEKDGIEAARKSLSMIVGRDTENLSEEQIIKACVETVAENTSDGVVAPLIYLCIGGPVFGLTYKACNTLDSMVGYKNEKYKNYGYFSAKTDDILNYIPSRICALLIVIVAFCLKEFSGINSFKIWKRDKRNHKSPNSAQSEAAYAGAMGLKLAGGSYYFGEYVDKPFIGDEVKKIDRGDVKRSHVLLYGTSLLCEILCTAAIFILIQLNMIFR